MVEVIGVDFVENISSCQKTRLQIMKVHRDERGNDTKLS
jgi:hypothetical protein